MKPNEIRSGLRRLAAQINSARGTIAELKQLLDLPDSKEAYEEADHLLALAAEKADDLKEIHSIKAPKDLVTNGYNASSLTEQEEMAYDALNRHLRLPEAAFAQLTEAQKFSAARVILRQGAGVENAFLSDHLGIKFPHIYIGIEKDGYAHS